MTQRKRWPNEAENERLESIAEGWRAVAAMKQVAGGNGLALVEAMDAVHRIIKNLMTVGPGSEGSWGQKSAGMV